MRNKRYVCEFINYKFREFFQRFAIACRVHIIRQNIDVIDEF